jgi:para-nitrobenzyl esterase
MAEHERATKLAEAVLAELGLKANQVDQLQALPFERLPAAIDSAQKKLPPPGFQLLDRYGFGPVVDGRDLPHHPFDPTAADVSVMVGGTKDENAIFLAMLSPAPRHSLRPSSSRDRKRRQRDSSPAPCLAVPSVGIGSDNSSMRRRAKVPRGPRAQ